jgi:hypothetical protein
MDFYFTLEQVFGEKNGNQPSPVAYPEFFHLLYSLSEAVSRSLIKE